MKRISILMIFTTLAAALWGLDVTILSLQGSVEVKELGRKWTTAREGQIISPRSMISTGFGSRAKLSAGGMELNLKPLTRLSLDSLIEEGGVARTELSLQSGRVRATRPPATRQTRRAIDFRVSTPVATAAVRGTDFFLSTDKLVTVEGLVEFSQSQATVLVPGGSYTWADPGQHPENPLNLLGSRWSVAPDDSDQSLSTKDGDAQVILR